MLTASLRDIAHVNPVELAERIGIDTEQREAAPATMTAEGNDPAPRGRLVRGWSALRKVPTFVAKALGFASGLAGRVFHRRARAHG